MKYAIICLAVLGIGLFATCGSDDNGGPHCEVVATCEPMCNFATQWCDGTTCKDNIACEPACAMDGTEYCMPSTGECWKVCNPACATDGTEWCNKDGTCETLPAPPVCDPACVLPEVCVN